MSLLLLFPDLGTPTVVNKCYYIYQNNRLEVFENDILVWSFES